MDNVLATLRELGITYERYDHPPVYTVEEASAYDSAIDAGKTKNLFLRNKKGTAHYLVVADAETQVGLDKLAEALGESRLSFASTERLERHLGVTPGSVSPLGVLNDTAGAVSVVVDARLFEYEKLGFHPNDNRATLVISAQDLKTFFEHTGHSVTEITL